MPRVLKPGKKERKAGRMLGSPPLPISMYPLTRTRTHTPTHTPLHPTLYTLALWGPFTLGIPAPAQWAGAPHRGGPRVGVQQVRKEARL